MSATRPFDTARFVALRAQLPGRLGRTLGYAAETGSTNDDALAAARAGAESGRVFIADHQTSGRGRRGKSWVAAPCHNLLFSLLLRPDSSRVLVSTLTLAVGLGVRAALAPHSRLPLSVKWPNDVLAGPRKLAGILCEGQLDGPALSAVVIGIGINVFDAQFPPELAPSVACLEELAASGAVLEREALLAQVLAAVEDRVGTCVTAGFAALAAEFGACDALAGSRVEVSGTAPITGTARGVDASGRLLVESDGLLVPVVSGTVRAL